MIYDDLEKNEQVGKLKTRKYSIDNFLQGALVRRKRGGLQEDALGLTRDFKRTIQATNRVDEVKNLTPHPLGLFQIC